MISNNIPIELRKIIDLEETDFIVKSKRNYPRKKAIALLGVAVFWNMLVSIFVVAFFGPLFKEKEVHFESNGTPTTANLDNLEPLLVPGLLIGFFVLIGLGLLFWGLIMLIQKGGYFVGTETRFIKYRKGTAIIKDWEQFSGNIEIKLKENYGNLQLELRTGKMNSRKNAPDKFVPDIIYMPEIGNVLDIEKKCRVRIKENDPTPKITTIR